MNFPLKKTCKYDKYKIIKSQRNISYKMNKINKLKVTEFNDEKIQITQKI